MVNTDIYYIYNMLQSDFYIKNGIMPTGTGLGNKGDAYLIFKNTNKLQEVFARWNDICKNGYETDKNKD